MNLHSMLCRSICSNLIFVAYSNACCVSQELVEGELPHGVTLATQAEESETEGVVAMTFAVSYFLD